MYYQKNCLTRAPLKVLQITFISKKTFKRFYAKVLSPINTLCQSTLQMQFCLQNNSKWHGCTVFFCK